MTDQTERAAEDRALEAAARETATPQGADARELLERTLHALDEWADRAAAALERVEALESAHAERGCIFCDERPADPQAPPWACKQCRESMETEQECVPDDNRAPAGAQERPCKCDDSGPCLFHSRPEFAEMEAHAKREAERVAAPLAPQPQPDRAALDIAVAALEDIADMRAYDQDDAHRLRHKAVATLVRLKLREPDRSQLSAFPAPGVYTQEQAERRRQPREEPPYEGHSPNGRCAQCGAYVWVEMGFCGVCHPERL